MTRYLLAIFALLSLPIYGDTAGSSKEPYIILSIDGGGIRGLIPTTILALAEEHLGLKIAQTVNCCAGTSTGGIVALGVTLADPQAPKTPLYWAKELQSLYLSEAQAIFSRSWEYELVSMNGLLRPKYQAHGITQVMKKEFGKYSMKQLVCDVCITSFDLITHAPFLFENFSVAASIDYPLLDVVLSTTAAPTYFPSHIYQGHNLADGGMIANNPAAWAYLEAIKRPELQDREIYVFSVGTGTYPEIPITKTDPSTAGLISPLVSDLMDIADENVAEMFRSLSTTNKVHYIRWQPRLETASQAAMDNIHPSNLQDLVRIGKAYFYDHVNDSNFQPLWNLLMKRAQQARLQSQAI